MNKIIGVLFTSFVLLAAGYAFSARHGPPLPATQLRIENLLMLDAEQAGKTIVAVGEAGQVFRSDSGGQHWTQSQSPTQSLLTGLRFVDEKTGWAVGHDAVILKSSDNGANWTQMYSAPDEQVPLADIWFSDADHGYAIGAYATFLETADGGKTWQARKIVEDDKHLNAIAHLDDGTLMIAGEAGTLLHSSDGGANWVAIDTPYKGSFFGLLPLKAGTVLAFGMRGNVLRSVDNGQSWSAVPTGTLASLFGGRVMADGRVVLVGQDGAVLDSRDQGASFKSLENSSSFASSALIALDGKTWLLFGEGGVKSFSPTP